MGDPRLPSPGDRYVLRTPARHGEARDIVTVEAVWRDTRRVTLRFPSGSTLTTAIANLEELVE